MRSMAQGGVHFPGPVGADNPQHEALGIRFQFLPVAHILRRFFRADQQVEPVILVNAQR